MGIVCRLVLGSPPFSRRFELATPCVKDLLFASRQFVGRRDVTDRAVKTLGVVMCHELGHQPPRVVEREGCFRADGRVALSVLSQIGIGGSLAAAPLPHHRAYGSRTRRFDGLRSHHAL